MADNTEKTILCNHCEREITTKDDLVTANLIFSVVPFHGKCYSNALKGCQTVVIGNTPVNGTASTLLSVLAVLLGLISILGSGGPLPAPVGWILFLPAIYRLYSYLAYERYLR